MKQLVDYEKIEALNRRLERIMEEFMSFKNELLQNLNPIRSGELSYLLNTTIDFMEEIHSILREKPQKANAQKIRNERRKQNVGK